MTSTLCNRANMTTWIEALESGRYAQVQSSLMRKAAWMSGAGYCCLGVAAIEAKEHGVDLRLVDITTEDDIDANEIVWAFEWKEEGSGLVLNNGDILPTPVMEWLGIDTENPIVEVSVVGRSVQVSVLNDEMGWDFEQIAEALRLEYGIRREVEGQETLNV